jgi:hypothetical protein
MTTIPSGHPGFHRARDHHVCSAKPCLCGGTIGEGEVHVSVHDCQPQMSSAGRPLTHLRHNHFSAHYHVVCFFLSHTTDTRTSVVRYEFEDLEHVDRHGDEARRLLDDFRRN